MFQEWQCKKIIVSLDCKLMAEMKCFKYLVMHVESEFLGVNEGNNVLGH